MSRWLLIAAWALLPAAAWGDTLVLRNGQVKQGRIVARDTEEIRLELDQDGIKAVLAIPRADIVRIEESPLPAPPPPAPAATSPAPPATSVQAPGQFFRELFLSSLGQGPDSPDRLPADLHQLWQNVLDAEASGKLDRLLLAMKILADAMPQSAPRLDAIGLREKGKPFGQWMAQTRWQLIANRYQSGVFDLKEVAAIERRELLAILRAQTPAAVDPLRQFFPPAPIPGQPYPRNNPLLNISASNALVVKDRGLYASAILGGQLKLDPTMSYPEKVPLTTQLMYVRRCIQRANDFAPAARANLQREERLRREAEARARRQSLFPAASSHP